MANPYNKGRPMWIKNYSNWLAEMQLNLIDKQEKQSISEAVKRRKFFNYLLQYMEATLIHQIKEDWMCKYLVQQAESCQALQGHITVPNTTTHTMCQACTKPHNPHCNRLRNGRQLQNTAFNSSNNNPSNRVANSHPSNYLE